jgi:hypothetical protein
MPSQVPQSPKADQIPSSLTSSGALRFWLAVVPTGIGAGLLTGAGHILLQHLSSGNGIDTTAAIWFHAGRMPPWRTLGSAVLSVIIVPTYFRNGLEFGEFTALVELDYNRLRCSCLPIDRTPECHI